MGQSYVIFNFSKFNYSKQSGKFPQHDLSPVKMAAEINLTLFLFMLYQHIQL